MPQRYLYVYILRCSNSNYYTGITNNLGRRLQEHQSGVNPSCYTAHHLPVTLVYYQQFSDFNLAIHWEKRLKRWSKTKKEALIRGDWDQLKLASICKNETKSPSHELL